MFLSTFVLFPLLGSTLRPLLEPLVTPQLPGAADASPPGRTSQLTSSGDTNTPTARLRAARAAL